MRIVRLRSKALSLAKACSIGFRSGRQQAQGGAGSLDGLTHTGHLVRGEIVHDDDVAITQCRRQHLLDIGDEQLAVDGAVDDAGRGRPVLARAGNEGLGPPAPKPHRAHHTPAAFGTAISRVMLVLVQIPSMTISRQGRDPAVLPPLLRAVATSGRSCSAARRDLVCASGQAGPRFRRSGRCLPISGRSAAT